MRGPQRHHAHRLGMDLGSNWNAFASILDHFYVRISSSKPPSTKRPARHKLGGSPARHKPGWWWSARSTWTALFTPNVVAPSSCLLPDWARRERSLHPNSAHAGGSCTLPYVADSASWAVSSCTDSRLLARYPWRPPILTIDECHGHFKTFVQVVLRGFYDFCHFS